MNGDSTILVVDDNRINRMKLSINLKEQGYHVLLAEDGHQALTTLENEAVDLVLLDIIMPEFDGYQVLEKMKAKPTFAQIPVIVISALDEAESVGHCLEIGADDYLAKPFEPLVLKSRVAILLERQRLRETVANYERQLTALSKMITEGVVRDDLIADLIAQQEGLGKLAAAIKQQLA